jgi:sulfur relay (sulfurtransferase) DsrF/TusC family protein
MVGKKMSSCELIDTDTLNTCWSWGSNLKIQKVQSQEKMSSCELIDTDTLNTCWSWGSNLKIQKVQSQEKMSSCELIDTDTLNTCWSWGSNLKIQKVQSQEKMFSCELIDTDTLNTCWSCQGQVEVVSWGSKIRSTSSWSARPSWGLGLKLDGGRGFTMPSYCWLEDTYIICIQLFNLPHSRKCPVSGVEDRVKGLRGEYMSYIYWLYTYIYMQMYVYVSISISIYYMYRMFHLQRSRMCLVCPCGR